MQEKPSADRPIRSDVEQCEAHHFEKSSHCCAPYLKKLRSERKGNREYC